MNLFLAYRTFAEGIYKPPQISPDDTLGAILERSNSSDYRQLYIEQPRVRLDGVYIAVCHYMCAAVSEFNAFFTLTFRIF
jgi:F-box protein 9